MKAIYFTILFTIITSKIFADGEQVCVDSGTGQSCSASQLGPVNPCATLLFKVNYLIPPGYVIVSKYEWFVNGVSVYINTSPSDPAFQYTIVSRPTNVSCKVTYKKQDGTLSSPFPSNTFTPTIKDLDFPQTIATSTPPANYGCASATVSYSLPETVCSGSFCDLTYNVLGNYNITWQAPAGWVQTSLTNKGSNVSFTPNATSAGALIASIHLTGCSYTETRTFNVTRGASAPTFTSPTVTSCTATASVSIVAQCGASNYTYTITGIRELNLPIMGFKL